MPQQLIVFAQRAIAGDGGDKGDAGCLSGHGTWVVNLLDRKLGYRAVQWVWMKGAERHFYGNQWYQIQLIDASILIIESFYGFCSKKYHKFFYLYKNRANSLFCYRYTSPKFSPDIK